MPAPPPPVILALATPALMGNGVQGAFAPMLALGLSLCTSGALMAFLPLCSVPAQLGVMDPLSGTGTLGPAPIVGGLPGGIGTGLASAAFAAQGLLGEHTPRLASAYGDMLCKAASLFLGNVLAGPTAIAGYVAGPCPLVGAPPSAGQLQPLCLDALHANQIEGSAAEGLAAALAAVLAGAFLGFQGMVTVAAGRPCAPAGAAAPGVLV